RVTEVATLEQRIDRKLARELLVSDLAGFFAVLTLVLVTIGMFGTLAYTVARRTNEIGIRIALGARTADAVTLVMRDVLVVLAIGVVAGVGGGLAAGHFIASMLFGLAPSDATTIAYAASIICVATVTAAIVPVRRAVRID